MDSEIRERLVRVISWGGYGAGVFCLLLGWATYSRGELAFFGWRMDDMRDGVPLIWWGLKLLVVTPLTVYVLDGRTPIARDTTAQLLSPAILVAVFGLAVLAFGGQYEKQTGVLLLLLGGSLAIIVGLMAWIVKGRGT